MALTGANPAIDESVDSVCDTCQSFISAVKDFLTQDEVVASIIRAIQVPCDFYDLGDLTKQCNEVVDGYIRAALDDFKNFLDSDVVCVYLMYCESADDSIDSDENELNAMSFKHHHKRPNRRHHHHHRHHNQKPSICEVSLNNVQNMIHHHAADKKVIAALNEICSTLHVSSKQCKQFVNGHFSNILGSIKTSSSDELCNTFEGHLNDIHESLSLKSLNHKSGSKVSSLIKSPFVMEKLEHFNDMPCFICTSALQEVQHILQGENLDNLKNIIEGSCQAIPDSYRDMCTGIIDVVFANIAQMIKDFDPNDICNQLGLCGGNFELRMMLNLTMENADKVEKVLSRFRPLISSFNNVVMKKIH